MQDFEKLGAFYLGRLKPPAGDAPTDDLLLYDARDLTTHAVCVGMTGSGKTGLCLTLLEEAAIDGIPAIIVDPKGDLGNLLLTFPELRPADFQPWIDPSEAARNGISAEQQARNTAELWKAGLAAWGQTGRRIQLLRDAADIAIYTPGSQAGLPLSVLRTLAAPDADLRQDAEAFRERIAATAAGLLGLLGIDADPLRSRESILLSGILDEAWRGGRALDMASLVRAIQRPPFEQVGVIDVESFFPAQDRFAFSMRLNNLIAAPGFAAWMEGEPLDIQRLLRTSQGKPRLSILSIAHLSDPERMFFVTILLNELIAWMRSQSGTSSLRALFYMDEVFGYFPPIANPPSKTPMLTLLKQARAYGLGCVLATQNPVDLDYKGLSNAGTWFLGRLQTERDKARVLDGLEGASTSAGAAFDRARIEQTLSGLGSRMFLMNNVHDDAPVVFETRWALSFLRGPLTRDQIQELMAARKAAAAGAPSGSAAAPAACRPAAGGPRPLLPPGITELFLPRTDDVGESAELVYRPVLLGNAAVHFSRASLGVDVWEKLTLEAPVDGDVLDEAWEAAGISPGEGPELRREPEPQGSFAGLPADLSNPKTFSTLATALRNFLYRSHRMTLWKHAGLKIVSQPGEREGDFRTRISHAVREARDAQIEKLRQKYTPRLAGLQEQLRKAQQRVEKEKSQVSQQMFQTALSFGASILGAMFSRKLASTTNMNRAASSLRAAGRVSKEKTDVGYAEESAEAVQQRLADLEAEFEAETASVRISTDADQLALETIEMQPNKSDITVNRVALVWTPWRIRSDGMAEPLTRPAHAG